MESIKVSRKEYLNQWFEKDKDRIQKQRKEYRFKNKEKLQNYFRERNLKKQSELKLYRKEYYQKNKEYIDERNTNYIRNRSGLKSKINKTYRDKNPEKIKITKKLSRLKNKNTEQKYNRQAWIRLVNALRSRTRSAIKKERKQNKFIELCGCDQDFLKLWLERQFKPGMSWSNYGRGGWHIDHIRPCSTYDFSDIKQQFVCFHYTNLQPLTEFDNLSKHCKY